MFDLGVLQLSCQLQTHALGVDCTTPATSIYVTQLHAAAASAWQLPLLRSTALLVQASLAVVLRW